MPPPTGLIALHLDEEDAPEAQTYNVVDVAVPLREAVVLEEGAVV